MDYPNMAKASDLTGVKVKNLTGTLIGEVSELVINKLSGKISYVVVDFSKFQSFGNKYFSFPWHVFQYCVNGDFFSLDVDIELLKNTTGFDKEKWPNFHATDLEKYYQ